MGTAAQTLLAGYTSRMPPSKSGRNARRTPTRVGKSGPSVAAKRGAAVRAKPTHATPKAPKHANARQASTTATNSAVQTNATNAPKAQRAVRTAPHRAASATATSTAAATTTAVEASVRFADKSLFLPLTAGETADALRTLTEDKRLLTMAKIGRYRVICAEPLVVKPPHWLSGHRLARIMVYDYANDRSIDAAVDLDSGIVAHLDITRAQPMLSREEEAMAISIALQDEEVRAALTAGEQAQLATHYWGRDENDLAYSRRSAAVLFGSPGAHPTTVVVVDLLDNAVTQVVPASHW